MALSDQVTAPAVAAETPAATPTPQTSGPTHVKSGPNGPDPTGLRGTLETNFAKAAEKAAAETNSKKKPENVSRETQGERGADGKFLSKTPADPQASALVPEPDEPPSSWRAETKALWKELEPKLGPEQTKLLKDELRKRENDFKNGIMAKDAELRTAKPLYDELQPLLKENAHLWEAQGIPTGKALGTLIQLNANFRRDPAGTIKWLAQSAGLDLSKLAAGAPQAGGQSADPQLAPLYNHINGLTQELHQIKSGMDAQTTSAAASEIQQVIDEKDAAGQPKRPHFANEAVFKEIQLASQSLRAQHPDWSPRRVIEEAYDRSILAVPDTRQAYIDSLTGKQKSDAEADARQRAAEAASKFVKGGPPNHLNGKSDPKDLRGTLTSHYNARFGSAGRVS